MYLSTLIYFKQKYITLNSEVESKECLSINEVMVNHLFSRKEITKLYGVNRT